MSIKIVNLHSYTTPKIVEVKNKEWVAYGEDNNYFQYLIDRYNGSPTNNASINGISQLIFGKGLDATDSNKRPEEYAKMKSLFDDGCVRKLCNDLKLMGQCSLQIIYSKDRTKVAQVEHFPVETLRAEKCNDDGEIEGYYYCADWSKHKPQDELKRIPAFGFSSESIEMLYIKPYKTGFYYYSPVDYQGGLQYSELEEEIANYHLNNILNGLAPSMLINFNNGIPTEEERQMIEGRIQEKFSGSSNAGKFILAFNDNTEQAATLEPVQLSDAHNQYQFLSDESMRKIMVSHRIVSPMLLGIKDNSGFGNNAEELETASTLMDNTVIRPFQNMLINAFDQVLAVNKISLNLYFRTLQPLEFTDLENATTKEQVEEETGQKLSSEKPDVSEEVLSGVLKALEGLGEDEEEDYVLVDERPSDALKDAEMQKMLKFANVIKGSPSKKSEQDTSLFKIRYQYAPLDTSPNSREFCKKMVKAKKLYRVEDLDKDLSMNPGFGKGGSESYNPFLFKGGVNCKHFWMRKIYMRKNNKKITVTKARELINDLEPSERADARYESNDKRVAQIAGENNNFWRA